MANQRLNIDIVARDKSKQALNNVRGALSKVKGAVFNLQNAFIGLGAGLVIRNLISTGKELENLQVRLKFLLKNTNEGAKAFENMTKFASKVPFSLEEIQSGAGILATVTDNAKDLNQMLEITGNVAAVTGLDFRTTAEQIQRSFSAGIGAADLFREKGVRNMLGFKAGATVSIEETVAAFEKTFGKGGRFGKATDELANTFAGTMSMIGDKIFSFKKNLLDAGFFAELKKQFKELDKSLASNSESLERIAVGFGTVLAKAVKGLGDLFILLAKNIDSVITAFKILVAFKIVTFFISLGKAIVPVLAGLRGIAALSGVGLALVAASVAATTATFVALNKQIDKTVAGLTKAVDKNLAMRTTARELAIMNRTYKEDRKEIVQLTEREAGIIKHQQVELKTTKTILEDLNNTALENIQLKFKNIKQTIAEGINGGITSMSQALSKSLVFGEKLSDTLRNMALNVLARITAILIEQIARQSIQIAMEHAQTVELLKKLSIEKLITDEKRKQQSASAGGSDNMGSSLVRMASSFLGFAKGGAVSKGQPVVVGERGAELFIPNSTGQITQSARGTGGGQTTVNFNINTVDASGFEELLVRSRGTITQLINSAVNERGSRNLI
jgi:hypothetical protein